MVAITDYLAPVAENRPARARRMLAVMLLAGVVSFALIADHRMPQLEPEHPTEQGNPFTIGVSAIGGPDCLGGCRQ
jgi:hypothetical protein